jgi:hypothetical protein
VLGIAEVGLQRDEGARQLRLALVRPAEELDEEEAPCQRLERRGRVRRRRGAVRAIESRDSPMCSRSLRVSASIAVRRTCSRPAAAACTSSTTRPVDGSTSAAPAWYAAVAGDEPLGTAGMIAEMTRPGSPFSPERD